MEKYVPYVLLSSVLLVAAVGLTLSLSENTTSEIVAERQCSSANPSFVNCLTPNGGCPQRYPPYKQYGMYIGNIPTCCCAPIKSADNFRYGQSLYR